MSPSSSQNQPSGSRRARAKVSYKEDKSDESTGDESGKDRPRASKKRKAKAAQSSSSSEEDTEGEDLDSDELDAAPKSRKKGTAKRIKGPASSKRKDKPKSTTKKRKTGSGNANDIDYSQDEDEDNDDSVELGEGEVFAGKIIPAPKTGHVPPGQVSRNTFKFLVNLQDPAKNDREWFKLHEPSYRLAEKEWVAFVQAAIPKMRQVDTELPMVPPKDLIHRIYRDVRFSNDKTAYKRHFSASFSRSGRKGIWAGYFISIQPRNKSILAGGVWGPGKNELASIRHSIQQDSAPLKQILSEPEFCKQFGKFDPRSGERSNVFGHSDALKTAPRGVAKDHPDIELLKLRSVAAVHTFLDTEVLDPEFMERLLDTARAIRPLITYLNNAIALPAPSA